MRNFWILPIWYFIFFGGNALLKKIFHIYDDRSKKWWFEKKLANIIFISWILLMVLLGFKGIVNLPFILFGMLVPLEIGQGLEQYRYHKEKRIYILHGWSLFCILLFYIFITIFFDIHY